MDGYTRVAVTLGAPGEQPADGLSMAFDTEWEEIVVEWEIGFPWGVWQLRSDPLAEPPPCPFFAFVGALGEWEGNLYVKTYSWPTTWQKVPGGEAWRTGG